MNEQWGTLAKKNILKVDIVINYSTVGASFLIDEHMQGSVMILEN